MVKLYKTRRNLTGKQRINILFATYRSLSDFTRRRQGPCQTACELQLPQTTVSSALQQFEACGRDVSAFIKPFKAKGKSRIVIGSDKIGKHLLSEPMLQRWIP